MSNTKNDQMITPYCTDEHKIETHWQNQTVENKLKPIPCLSAWIDVCGFGSQLESAEWDLNILQDQNLLKLLNIVYEHTADPFWMSLPPLPYEKTLIINDGVAKTLDLKYASANHDHTITHYIKCFINTHFRLLQYTRQFGLGIRTVLAGGHRVQYSPTTKTGNSQLFYDKENKSEIAKQILERVYLYNPSEFQMNTAFAKAFTIDSMGGKSGFHVNGFFIEKSFLELLSTEIPRIGVEYTENQINISISKNHIFTLHLNGVIPLNHKGISTVVYNISSTLINVDEQYLINFTELQKKKNT